MAMPPERPWPDAGIICEQCGKSYNLVIHGNCPNCRLTENSEAEKSQSDFNDDWMLYYFDDENAYEAIVELKNPDDLSDDIQIRTKLSDTIMLVCGSKMSLENLAKSDNVLRITSPISLSLESSEESVEKYHELLQECEEINQTMDQIDEINDSQQPAIGTATDDPDAELEPIRPEIINRVLVILDGHDTKWLTHEELIASLEISPNKTELEVIERFWQRRFGSESEEMTPLEDA